MKKEIIFIQIILSFMVYCSINKRLKQVEMRSKNIPGFSEGTPSVPVGSQSGNSSCGNLGSSSQANVQDIVQSDEQHVLESDVTPSTDLLSDTENVKSTLFKKKPQYEKIKMATAVR
ncbi:MAG TPA: hypothetical protein PLL02_01020 [Bacteroidales bacterium]|nr:hypothetical protein [Bacteroidales bacterium]